MRSGRITSAVCALVSGVLGSALACSRQDATPAADQAAPSATVSASAHPPAAVSTTPSGGAAALRQRLGPFVIDEQRYIVEIERYLVPPSDTGTRRVIISDTTGRVVYEEDVTAIVANDAESWVELSVSALEDASRRPRALELTYGAYPSAPGSGVSLRFLVPRNGVLQPLAPLFTYFGELDRLPSGSQARSQRLLPGDRFIVKEWRYHFAAILPYRIDLACTRSEECITRVLPDSIAGLARFAIETEPRPVEEAATIELFPSPGLTGGAPEQLTVDAETKIEFLGGAGRMGAPPFSGSETESDWLLIRVNGKTGWIHGQSTFTAVGLPTAG